MSSKGINTELLGLSLRVGYRCVWSDKEIMFTDYGVTLNNKGLYTFEKPVHETVLKGIIRVSNKWLELQKIGSFKEV